MCQGLQRGKGKGVLLWRNTAGTSSTTSFHYTHTCVLQSFSSWAYSDPSLNRSLGLLTSDTKLATCSEAQTGPDEVSVHCAKWIVGHDGLLFRDRSGHSARGSVNGQLNWLTEFKGQTSLSFMTTWQFFFSFFFFFTAYVVWRMKCLVWMHTCVCVLAQKCALL